MTQLEKAIAIAVDAHKGQTDKAGTPYILHPLRLMLRMRTENDMIVAVLHDLVEDCKDWDFARLENQGFNTEILEALRLLTRDKKEDYEVYIGRIKLNKIALKVKLADLEDNLDIKRIAKPKTKDYERLKRYLKTFNELKELV